MQKYSTKDEIKKNMTYSNLFKKASRTETVKAFTDIKKLVPWDLLRYGVMNIKQ